MAIQKLIVDVLEDQHYELIAIHCSLAPYKLAFLLNKHIGLQLYRSEEDINYEYNEIEAKFPLFQFDDTFHYQSYSLISNKYLIKLTEENTSSNNLFSDDKDRYVAKYLIPELKKVDYFIKVETEISTFSCKSFISDISNISQIIAAYKVEPSELKSKNNLIFE